MTEYVVGADEVGRGPWAGPMLVCAALVPKEWTVPGLNDSKKLSEKKRTLIYDLITDCRPFVQLFTSWVWPEEIDRMGLGRANVKAFREVVLQARRVEPQARIILDGTLKLFGIDHESYPKADGMFPAVMAASVYAKVERDRWMHTEGDSAYPVYRFIDHVGYGTLKHQQALKENGPCPLHRFSFAPLRNAYGDRAVALANYDVRESLQESR